MTEPMLTDLRKSVEMMDRADGPAYDEKTKMVLAVARAIYNVSPLEEVQHGFSEDAFLAIPFENLPGQERQTLIDQAKAAIACVFRCERLARGGSNV